MGLYKLSVGILRVLYLIPLKGALGVTAANEFDEEKASIIVCLVRCQHLALW